MGHFIYIQVERNTSKAKMNKIILSFLVVAIAAVNAQAPSQALADCICSSVAGDTKSDEDTILAADGAAAAAGCYESHPLAKKEIDSINNVKSLCSTDLTWLLLSLPVLLPGMLSLMLI